jgi:hypothetical protein
VTDESIYVFRFGTDMTAEAGVVPTAVARTSASSAAPAKVLE